MSDVEDAERSLRHAGMYRVTTGLRLAIDSAIIQVKVGSKLRRALGCKLIFDFVGVCMALMPELRGSTFPPHPGMVFEDERSKALRRVATLPELCASV